MIQDASSPDKTEMAGLCPAIRRKFVDRIGLGATEQPGGEFAIDVDQ
jgi:hypothetical protein